MSRPVQLPSIRHPQAITPKFSRIISAIASCIASVACNIAFCDETQASTLGGSSSILRGLAAGVLAIQPSTSADDPRSSVEDAIM